MFKVRLPVSDFNRNVATLFIGTVAAQSIPVLFSPLLTRVYSPEQYGTFALFFAIANTCSIVATARYEMAIVLPRQEAEAHDLQKICYIVSLALGALAFFVIVFFEESILQILEAPDFGFWLYFIPLNIVLAGFFQTINARFNRERKFREMSRSKIVQNSVNGIFSLALGFSRLLGNGLIVGHLFGFLFGVVVFIRKAHAGFDLPWKRLKSTAYRYRHFSILNAPTALLNTIASNVPLFFISSLGDKAYLGLYGLVERVINAPIGLISYSVSQVLLEDVAVRNKEGRPVRVVVFRLLRHLFLIGIAPFSILFFFAADIFEFVFGSEWRTAGDLASILSVAFFLRFIVSPLTVVFISLNRLKQLTLWQSLYFSTTLGIAMFSYFANADIAQYLKLVVANDVVMYSLYVFLIHTVLKK